MNFALALIFLLSSVAARPQGSATMDQLLRLRKGNYWIYSGTAEWSETGQGAKTGKQPVRWKTEILEESTHGNLKAYMVSGSPFDLAWYGPGTKAGQSIWIVYQNRFYQLTATSEMLKRFHDLKDSLVDLVEKAEPVLQLPLVTGSCTRILKPEAPRERTDLMYCWYNRSKRKKILHAAGVPGSAEVWEAWYGTAPDHEIVSFAPGVGIVAYDYSHHGTRAEAHVKLWKAHLR